MTTVNPQGLSRKDKGLMSALLFDDGYVGFSADLSAGEPTVTAHYSGDPNYRAANFEMVGKEPFFDRQSVLQISDMYLMGASVSPSGTKFCKELYHTKFGGVDFREQWVIDAEVIKNDANVKPVRSFHKMQVLAMNYGQGPNGMVRGAFTNGYSLSIKDAKNFHYQFWHKLFPKVRVLGEALTGKWEREGHLINDFGFRLLPDSGHKCLNYFIQSTVSGIMNVLCMKFFNACPFAEFIVIIHDEVIFQVPEERVDEAKKLWFSAVDSLNQDLKWTVNIRSGLVTGRNFYEAK